MLELYIKSGLLRDAALDRLKRELDRTKRAERGLSEAASTALLVVLAIAIVAILATAITVFINNKAAIIAGS